MSAIFLYKNLVDTGTLTASDTVSGFPVTNLQKRQLSSTWRGLALNSPKITIDFGGVRQFRTVVLAGINADGASRANDATVEYSDNGSVWTADNNIVLPVDAGCQSLPRTLAAMVGSAASKISKRYMRIAPAWTRKNNAVYFEIGRILVGDVIEVPEGCENGWTEGVIDPGTVDASAGNQIYGDPRSTGRTVTLPFPGGVPNIIARGFAPDDTGASDVPSFQDMFLRVGKTLDVYVAQKSESPLWLRRTGIYGRLSPESLSLVKAPGDSYSAEITVIEER